MFCGYYYFMAYLLIFVAAIFAATTASIFAGALLEETVNPPQSGSGAFLDETTKPPLSVSKESIVKLPMLVTCIFSVIIFIV